jgi:hypothetical protein
MKYLVALTIIIYTFHMFGEILKITQPQIQFRNEEANRRHKQRSRNGKVDLRPRDSPPSSGP